MLLLIDHGSHHVACQVLLECAKRNMSQADFLLSLVDLQFSEEQRQIIAEVRVGRDSFLFVWLSPSSCVAFSVSYV